MPDMGGKSNLVDPGKFDSAFSLFKSIVKANEPGKREFVGFGQGVLYTEEGYKARTHSLARLRLEAETWTKTDVGTGTILERVISAIEVPGNNLLTWDDRNGPETRSHMSLVRAKADKALCNQTERLLLQIFDDTGNNAASFEEMIEITGRNYPLLGYLWFLKDIERFTPLRPQGLQAGLQDLGIDYQLSGRCSWENYSGFIDILQDLRPLISSKLDGADVPLIDAHSFIWVLGGWLRPEQVSSANRGRSGKATTYGPEEKAAWEMADSILTTVSSSNGQTVERTVKDKVTDMTKEELIAHLSELMHEKGSRCAISDLPLHLPGRGNDPDMQASPDRIDSDLGYLSGNIQVVCWFINRWKNTDSNENFARLLQRLREPREKT